MYEQESELIILDHKTNGSPLKYHENIKKQYMVISRSRYSCQQLKFGAKYNEILGNT